jgi:CDP-6-deoxy-D-xylo-4-hexulose-3-dehydrase
MSFSESSLPELSAEILRLTRLHAALAHDRNRPAETREGEFVPGQTTVPYAGRVFEAAEVEAAVKSSLDFWLTLGREGDAMEQELATALGVRRSILVNSGSSANLLAITALTSAKLPSEKRLRPGDEVITCAAGFPTTVAPIVQQGLVPVFIDNDPITGNADCAQLAAAFQPGRTKAVMMAHALGNPFDLAAVTAFCREHNLWLIEDNCDALGCTYSMPVEKAKRLGLDHLLKIAEAGVHPLIRFEPAKGSELSTFTPQRLTAPTGSFGDLSTQSFYPPHHITMGEGGAVNVVRDMRFKVIVESFRDWGRDCWCASGVDNTCGKRFNWQLGELPEGYDHKYIYSHLGYNLKPLDGQAAIGRVQLKRLAAFGAARRRNWQRLRAGLASLENYFEFSLPTHATKWREQSGFSSQPSALNSQFPTFEWDSTGCSTDPSWFGFMLLVRDDAPFTASQLTRHLDDRRIGCRRLFGGNLTRQPAFVQLRRDNPSAFRVAGELRGADRLMQSALFVGVFPGLTNEMLDYVIATIGDFCRSSARGRSTPS